MDHTDLSKPIHTVQAIDRYRVAQLKNFKEVEQTEDTKESTC